MSDGLKEILQQAKAAGASTEQLLRIAQTFKKKDSTESDSFGAQEDVPSVSTDETQQPAPVEVPNWMRNLKDTTPKAEYEVKEALSEEDRNAIYDEAGIPEDQRPDRGDGVSIIVEKFALENAARDRKANQAADEYEDLFSQYSIPFQAGGFGTIQTVSPLESEADRMSEDELERRKEDSRKKVNTIMGFDEQTVYEDAVEMVRNDYSYQKSVLSEIALERAKEARRVDKSELSTLETIGKGIEVAAWAAGLTDMPDREGDSGLVDSIEGFTKAIIDPVVKDIGDNAAILYYDAVGDSEKAERVQLEQQQRNLEKMMLVGLDPNDERGVTETFQDGETGLAALKFAYYGSQSVGLMAATIAQPEIGLALMGTSSGLSTYGAYRDRLDLSATDKATLSISSGAAEILMGRVLGGLGNVRRFRKAIGVSDDIGNASIAAKRKAYDKALDYIKPYSSKVKDALSNPTVRAANRFVYDSTAEAIEEIGVEITNQMFAHIIAGEDFDALAIADAGLLGFGIGAPMAGVTAAKSYAVESTLYNKPLKEDMDKYEELQAMYTDLKESARAEDNATNRKIILEEAAKVRDEGQQLIRKANQAYDKLDLSDKLTLSNINKNISKTIDAVKEATNKTVKNRRKNELAGLLIQKAQIEAKAGLDLQLEGSQREGIEGIQAREATAEGVAATQDVSLTQAQQTTEQRAAAAEQRVVKSTPKTMENKRVRYFDPVQGMLIEGTLIKDGQSLAVETDDKRILELGNFDELSDTPLQQIGLSDAVDVIQVNPDGSFTYNSVAGAAPQGTQMIPSVEGLKSIRRGKDGSIKRVVMKSPDGSETYNLTGQDAIDVAYQLHLQQLQTPESIAKVESELEQDEEAREILEAAERRQQDEAVREVDEVTEGRPSDDTQPAAEEPARPRIEGIGLEVKEETSKTISRFQDVMKRIVPDLRVVLHASRESYNQTYDNASKSNGHYNPETKTAHVLVDADTQLDNLTTLELLKHEIIHPLLDVFLQNSAAETDIAAEAVRGILNRLEGSRDAKKVLDHANKYKEAGRSQDVIDLELVTEFFAVFSNPASMIEARDSSPTFIERVKNLLNRLLRAMRITDGKTQLEKESDVRELLEKLTFAFSTGAQIRPSRQQNVENSKEREVKESLDNLGSPNNPYENAITPKRGLEPIEIYREWVNSKSNHIIAEDFEHSLEIRRAGFIESHQRKDGSIVLVEPSSYEKTDIDGIVQISSKSFMSDKDITDKRQKKISKTLSSFADAIELPIAFVQRPDLKFTSSIVYPDKVNGVEKPTMVVNLSFANARTGASAFSFAIVETLRKGVATTEKNRRGESIEFTTANFNEMIRAFEGEQVGKIQISDNLRSIYSSYKNAFIDTNKGSGVKKELEGQAQFHAISMTIQESIDKMITDVVTPSRNMDLFEFLSGIQEQLTAFLNSKLGDDNRKIFKVPLGEDFMELVGNVFVDKKIPINLELTAEQKDIESNLLERIEKTLTNAKRLEKIQRTFEDLSDLHKYVGDMFQPLSTLEKAVELHQQGKISDFALESIRDDAFMERGIYQRMNFNLDEADAYIDEMSEIIESVGKLFLKQGVDFKRIYSDFSKWRATGFADANVTPEMALYKKYYDTYPKSQQDWKFNVGAVNYFDVTGMQEAVIRTEDFLDLSVIAELAGMPYSLIKSSIEQIRVPDLEDAFFEFQKSMSVKVISKISDAKDYFESMAKETFEKIESAKDIDLDTRSLSESLKSFKDEFDYGTLEDIARESSILDKAYTFEYFDENGKSKKGEILVELGITHNGKGQRFIDVAYENSVNESAYGDNKKNLINVMKTMSNVFEFTQAVAQIFGADGITYSAVQIGKGRVNEDTHAKNLVDKSKGFNTSWFRRGINSNMAISKGGLQARSKRRVAFYDAKFNPDYIYITESPDILGLASAGTQNKFENESLSNQTEKIDSKEDSSFIIQNALFPSEEKAFKVAKTEAVPVEGLTSDEILEKVEEINNDSYVFADSEVVLNINMQAQPFATRSSVISLSGIRESLADIDVEDKGREGAESLDAIQENASKAILEQSKSKFWKRAFARKTWVDRAAGLKKAMSKGFSDYVQSLVVTRLGAGAYADRIYTRMRKEIYGKLDNTQLQKLDAIIIARRVIDIDRTWDERLSANQTKLKNELDQLKYYEEELKQAKIVKDKKLINEIKIDIKNSKKIISDTEAKVEKYSTRPLHPAEKGKKMNLEIAEATLKYYERTLGKQMYNKLSDRADKYFDAYREILQMQFEAGLIDAETRDRFINNDYSPRRFLVKMFGGVDDVTFQQMGLEQAQIKEIREGSDQDMFTDTEFLLSLSLRAVQNKKANNILFNEMYNEAKKKGFENIADGNFIADGNYKKNKKGEPVTDSFGNYIYQSEPSNSDYKHVFFKVDGKTRAFRINKKYYNDINGIKTINLSPKTKKFIRAITGTQLVKMTSTTLNTWFAITGTVRGFREVTRGRGVYDKYKALPLMQAVLFLDFVKAGKAAVLDTSLVEEYYEHGGGLSFMTTQGRPSKSYRNRNKFALGFLQRRGINVNPMNALAFLGEKSELALRLAVYERSKKELTKQYPEASESEIKYMAVKEAREIADFSQSGELSSEVDLVVPYFNAAIQGTRASWDYARKNPVMAAQKQIQGFALTVALGVMARNYFWDDEEEKDGMENIPDYKLMRYNIIPTGLKQKTGRVIDGKEEEEHIVLQIPKVHQFMFFDALAEITAKELVYVMKGKEVPKDLVSKDGDLMFLIEAFEGSFPAGQFSPLSDVAKGRGVLTSIAQNMVGSVPMTSAAIAYFGNYDLFRNKQISFEGEDKLANVQGYRDKNVHDIYKFMGDVNRNISPRNLEVATEKIIGSESTLLTALLYQLTDKLLTVQEETEGLPVEKVQKKLSNAYGFGKSIIYGIPNEKVVVEDKVEDEILSKVILSEDYKIKKNIRDLTKQYTLDELQLMYEKKKKLPSDIVNYIEEIDAPEVTKKRYLRYFRRVALRQEVKERPYNLIANAKSPELQAKLFLKYFGRVGDLTKEEKADIAENFTLLNFTLSEEMKAYLFENK